MKKNSFEILKLIFTKKVVCWLLSIFFFFLANHGYSQKKLTTSMYVDDASLSLTGDEFPEQIAVDKINNNEEDVYMTGVSYSAPVSATFEYCDSLRPLGNGDIFLTKYAYNNNTKKVVHKWNSNLEYAGAAGDAKDTQKIDRYDWAYCLTVDHDGPKTYIYVGGASLASTEQMACRRCDSMPTFQASPNDDWDGVIAKYDASDGSLVAYTYFGGRNSKDEILDIAIKPGPDHDVYVVGYTESGTIGRRARAAYDTSYNSGGDGFIAGFDNCLSTLKYYTYYTIDSSKSPSGQDRCHCLKFNADGSQLFVSGTADGSKAGIATYKNVYQHNLSGASDAFVGKWVWRDPVYAPVWGTYIGGDSTERGRKLTLTDSTITGATYVYVTGWTTSKNLKRVQGSTVPQLKLAGANDAFIVKLDGLTGRGIWATYFGGSRGDIPNGINWFYSKKTGEQYIALTGITASPDSIGFIHSYTGTDKIKQRLSEIMMLFLPPSRIQETGLL